MSSAPTHAKGYGVSDSKKYTDFSLKEFKLKTAEPQDVTLAIEVCGVCGSDVHTITGGWGGMSVPWCVPGHEIVGKVVHVGDEVKEFKVGQRVGVGAQVSSCLSCDRCKNDDENYCPEMLNTYDDKYKDGVEAQGGYSTMIRANQRFVFAIPDTIKSEHAAPMLCAGLTVYSPLVRHGVTSGKKVGIIGVGGLGHFAVQFAHHLGAHVVVFSHSPDKKQDALDLGADEFVDSSADSFNKPYQGKLDYILSCADAAHIPLGDYLTCLKVGGVCTSVGLPDNEWTLQPQAMMSNMCSVGSSHIGSKVEANAMLKLAAEKGIKPILEPILSMKDAGKAIEGTKTNKVRYRYVLRNDIE